MAAATSAPRTAGRWRSYREYRDSGIEWFGEIPEHWKLRRLKTIARVELSNVDKKSVEGEEAVRLCNYVDVYYNERITPELEFMQATATSDQVQRFSLRKGDVLVTKDSEAWNDIAVPAVVAEDLPDVLCGYHLALARPQGDCDGAFLSRAFAAIGPRNQFHVGANGITRFGLSRDSIRSGLFPVPPLDEQRAIVTFLDRETAKIDALIGKKEQLIGLLEEDRAALISDAVTKGLDSCAPMRDSDVGWIGDVPEHWKIERVKSVAKLESGHTPDRKIDAYWENGDIPWVSLADTGRLKGSDYISETTLYTNRVGLENSSARLLPERSVVFTRDASIGLCAITTRPMAVSQHVIAWVCGEKIRPEYLLRVFESMSEELNRLTMGATLRTIGLPEVKMLVTPVPPIPEQDRIVEYVQVRTSQIDALVAKVREHIERLREYRAALISAAVTGKIDVRDEVAA